MLTVLGVGWGCLGMPGVSSSHILTPRQRAPGPSSARLNTKHAEGKGLFLPRRNSTAETTRDPARGPRGSLGTGRLLPCLGEGIQEGESLEGGGVSGRRLCLGM